MKINYVKALNKNIIRISNQNMVIFLMGVTFLSLLHLQRWQMLKHLHDTRGMELIFFNLRH